MKKSGDAGAERLVGIQLFCLSFTSLFLELMLIRWVPAVVRLVAYYANLMLISSFLGLGVGAILASRRRSLFGWFPVLLTADVALLWQMSKINLVAGSSSEARFFLEASRIHNYAILLGVFAMNTALFVPLGQRIGSLFKRIPALRAYAWDLCGSLCGTISFGAFSLVAFSPIVGFTAIAVIYLMLAIRKEKLIGLICFPATILMVLFSTAPSAVWSPYYYITIAGAVPEATMIDEPEPGLRKMIDPPFYYMRVGRDFYQVHGALDSNRYSEHSLEGNFARIKRQQYILPYQLATEHRRVAVMGAGGGMDVEAALLSGAEHVDAVEIDPVLVANSRQYNAADPFGDPRVTVHIEDARAFVRAMSADYDMIVFGFLDSQALFSTMSNVRLDGYIYTVESMRTAYSKLAQNGTLSLSFACPTNWMAPKLVAMVREATGRQPQSYFMNGGLILCIHKGESPTTAPSRYGEWNAVTVPTISIDLPTDDWPYLYLQKRTIPTDYLVVIIGLLVLSVATITLVRGKGVGKPDIHFFCLGLGFLLLQTKSITDCSLYFGATWLVTTIVIAGVLMMVLLANVVANRMKTYTKWLYLPLLISLLVVHIVPRDLVLATSFSHRLWWALLVVPLPIFFAGLIFSTTFREVVDASSALGANMIGATIGGFAEYLGMAIGVHALGYIVFAAYLAALLLRKNRLQVQML